MAVQKHGRANWISWYVLGVVVSWTPTLLFIGHLVLGFAYRRLVWPVAVTVIVLICLGPLLFWAQQSAVGVSADFNRLYKVGGGLAAVFFILFSADGWYLGLLTSDMALLIGVLGALVIAPSAYFLHKRLLRKSAGGA